MEYRSHKHEILSHYSNFSGECSAVMTYCLYYINKGSRAMYKQGLKLSSAKHKMQLDFPY